MAELLPALQVQRMGKLWRIVYSENRNLARYNNGQPLDEGGFEGPDGQFECSKLLSQVIDKQSKVVAQRTGAGGEAPIVDRFADPEGEGVGH